MPLTGLLLPRQSQSCIACPSTTPPCNCADNEQCVLVNRDCNTCSYNKCIPISSSSSGGGRSISGGAVAAAVVCSVVFLGVVIAAFFWYRRRSRRARTAPAVDAKTDVPARAEDVLNRPDPNEKVQQFATQDVSGALYASAPVATMNADPEAQTESLAGTQGHNPVLPSDPFRDDHSIQSASTGTQSNVIPIALVGPQGSLRSNPSIPLSQSTNGSAPIRPVRSPDLDLNLDHTNVSSDGSRAGTPQSQTQRSHLTPTTGNIRNSYMSTGSFASDLLNEAPVIVTPTRGTVKQVVGVVKAEVIHTPPGSLSPNTDVSGTPKTASSMGSRPPYRSPLASSSFGPSDIMHETEEEDGQEVSVREDPFGDEHSPYPGSQSPATPGATAVSPVATSATFRDSTEEGWNPQGPVAPWAKSKKERPVSLGTQAGSVITASIGTASRVQVGLGQLPQAQTPAQAQTLHVPPSNDVPRTPMSAALSSPRSPYRMTSAKLVASPGTATTDMPTGSSGGSLERQLQRAIDDLESSRMSRSSVLTTSTRADSILEGFPFVPPSPISDRPIRTPPRSPLAQQSFNSNNNSDTNTPSTETSIPTPDSPLPAPPNRQLLGMSTVSLSSTASNGLGSFPFQIDNGEGPQNPDVDNKTPPPGVTGKQRASLDTLAITSDLASYPLGFDPNAMKHYPGPRR